MNRNEKQDCRLSQVDKNRFTHKLLPFYVALVGGLIDSNHNNSLVPPSAF